VLRPIRTREFVWAFAALVAVTLTALQQQTRDLYAVPDRGDPLFSMWRMAWVRHQLVADPRHLFDANIFYPLPATLTYSDSMLLPALASSALAALHVHPVVAYNVMLLTAFILSAAAAYALARALGVGPLGSWIAAVAFTIAPFRVNHLSHLELQMTMWMPVALLTTYRMLSEGNGDTARFQASRAVTLAVLLAAQWYSSMYYGLFLTMYLAIFSAVLIARHKVRDRRLWHLIAAVCIAAAVVSPLIAVYMKSAPDRGDRPRETVAAFSAVPADYVRTASRNPVYRALLPHTDAERALFPGATTIALAVAGAWPPLTASRVALIAGGIVAFDGSLGLNGVVYRGLYRWFPPLHSVRVPARFAVLVVLTLAMLAGIGAARLLSRFASTTAQIVAAACLTALIIVDGWPHSDALPVWRSPPTIYAALPARGSVLFEFPVHSPADRFSENLPYMYFSMSHWRPMVNGYSGFIPASYDALLKNVTAFPETPALKYLESIGVTHIALHCRLWEPDVCASTMARLDATTGLRRLARAEWYGAPSTLYELSRDPLSGIRGPDSGVSLNDRSLNDSDPGSRTPDPGMQR
jgi:hypothetical protein